ncbi:hemolysin secretion protein D [Ochrobactrum sp. MYb68]|nr:hemolysin secretion protein D [Ochrobactrum sp. MYb68]
MFLRYAFEVILDSDFRFMHPLTSGKKMTLLKSQLRSGLLWFGPVAVAGFGAWFYMSGGSIISEDDAYIGARNVAVNSSVPGKIVRVNVKDNQSVSQGDELFSIDPQPYLIAVNQARAQLQSARDQLNALLITYKQNTAAASQAQADVAYAESELSRAQALLHSSVGTQQAVDEATRNLKVARDQLTATQDAASSTLASLGGDVDSPVESRASYLQSAANLQLAERNLKLTNVTAPFSGIVTQVDSVQTGSFLSEGQPAFMLVSTDVWITANLKETDLVHVRNGDEVLVDVDNYPGRIFKGVVSSIAPASGTVFSLLPAQNASGNWIKVVQRIPIRINIEDLKEAPELRVGSSATVNIRTNYHRSLNTLLRDIKAVAGL